MKTVKEIASELEVSQVTVYNHIKKLDKELTGNIFKKQGVTHIDEEGVRQLKISMGLINPPVVKEYVSTEEIVSDISQMIVEDLSERLTLGLKEDMERMESNMSDNYDNLLNKIEALEEQNRALLEEIQSKNRETLWQRFIAIFKS